MRMLNLAEPVQNRGFSRPLAKQLLDRVHDVAQFREVAVVQAQATNQFPHSLDGVGFRAVGRQEQEGKVRFSGSSPFLVHGSVVILGIVDNERHPTAGPAADGVQTPEEGPSGHRIKFAFLPGKAELAVTQANRPEVSHAFAGGMMENNRIFHFRGNPHDGAGAVLLEMDFINSPEVIACARVGMAGQRCAREPDRLPGGRWGWLFPLPTGLRVAEEGSFSVTMLGILLLEKIFKVWHKSSLLLGIRALLWANACRCAYLTPNYVRFSCRY